MKTWNDYKEHIKSIIPEIAKDIDKVENISAIVSAMVEQHTSMGSARGNSLQCAEFRNSP